MENGVGKAGVREQRPAEQFCQGQAAWPRPSAAEEQHPPVPGPGQTGPAAFPMPSRARKESRLLANQRGRQFPEIRSEIPPPCAGPERAKYGNRLLVHLDTAGRCAGFRASNFPRRQACPAVRGCRNWRSLGGKQPLHDLIAEQTIQIRVGGHSHSPSPLASLARDPRQARTTAAAKPTTEPVVTTHAVITQGFIHRLRQNSRLAYYIFRKNAK